MARIIDVIHTSRDGDPIRTTNHDNPPPTCHRHQSDGNIEPYWMIRNKGGDEKDGAWYLKNDAVKKWFKRNQIPLDPDEWTPEQKMQFDLTWG